MTTLANSGLFFGKARMTSSRLIGTDEDAIAVLQALKDHPSYSLRELAEHLGWFNKGDGKPNRLRVYRLLDGTLRPLKLAQNHHRKWFISRRGEKVLADLRDPKTNPRAS
jgi:hypothetical protein